MNYEIFVAYFSTFRSLRVYMLCYVSTMFAILCMFIYMYELSFQSINRSVIYIGTIIITVLIIIGFFTFNFFSTFYYFCSTYKL